MPLLLTEKKIRPRPPAAPEARLAAPKAGVVENQPCNQGIDIKHESAIKDGAHRLHDVHHPFPIQFFLQIEKRLPLDQLTSLIL